MKAFPPTSSRKLKTSNITNSEARVNSGLYLVIVGVILSVLLLQQLSLPPLLLQGLLDERGHLALLARTLPANHKPATTRTVNDSPGNTRMIM
ncbi:hypothetical protein F7725_024952 [Dissostichus mawsoni]|uniref:Uncharacterized protein n=1 Tax=Dissostichus mawsoni TaxID=36200 RepID=A0A7J5XBF4_DISMA|nr:hypothetical protein F7725_024952 [Dissostichus mawsoni]